MERAPQAKLDALREQAASCRACDLWADATQTVFGEGRVTADIKLVGEQPGDREDVAGKPFVGPAGGLLDRALEDAGIDRAHVYVTNAVKHFKFERVSKRRLHKKPNRKQIGACFPWLADEIAVVQPKLVVCLGATAAQALLGADFRLTQHHGEIVEREGLPPVTATIHPSAVLRARDEDRAEQLRGLTADLRSAAAVVRRARRAS